MVCVRSRNVLFIRTISNIVNTLCPLCKNIYQ
jgi:hypothetical protein